MVSEELFKGGLMSLKSKCNKESRILLLGEFSGVHSNLKDGLKKLGYNDVTLASNGDYWRNFPKDIDFLAPFRQLSIRFPQIRPVLIAYSKLVTLLYSLKVADYDVVQLINPFTIDYRLWGVEKALRKLVKDNRAVFVLAAGDDAFFWRNARPNLEYGPFDDFLKYDRKGKDYHLDSDKALLANELVISLVHSIIPVMYEYQKSYQAYDNVSSIIPLPINTNEIKYTPNIPSGKLVVFHGLTRYGFKGTRHVEEAFKKLEKKYPNDLELRIVGNLPFDEYVNLLKRTNVVIDQTNCYSLGMNALASMAMGKVVLGGVEPESLDALGIHSSPAINIKPNSENIVESIENLLECKDSIEKIGHDSRRFIEDNHDYIKVAEKYVGCWSL